MPDAVPSVHQLPHSPARTGSKLWHLNLTGITIENFRGAQGAKCAYCSREPRFHLEANQFQNSVAGPHDYIASIALHVRLTLHLAYGHGAQAGIVASPV